jgi:hypothetical protein
MRHRAKVCERCIVALFIIKLIIYSLSTVVCVNLCTQISYMVSEPHHYLGLELAEEFVRERCFTGFDGIMPSK